ncbi:hypothetical protein ACH5RR_011640 [Cinchona calisaya]|uniref:HMA domain-containing protein n=1 Tax=Cinchona calisaya TaxID=153742 RepID=A0ABD3A6X8_9GENT
MFLKSHVLKVHLHCDGCARKVKKLLKKIEGVYPVRIDTEEQKVKVSGTVDSATLIGKLTKSGKHTELWPPSHKQYQNPVQSLSNSVNASNTQPMLPLNLTGESMTGPTTARGT